MKDYDKLRQLWARLDNVDEPERASDTSVGSFRESMQTFIDKMKELAPLPAGEPFELVEIVDDRDEKLQRSREQARRFFRLDHSPHFREYPTQAEKRAALSPESLLKGESVDEHPGPGFWLCNCGNFHPYDSNGDAKI